MKKLSGPQRVFIVVCIFVFSFFYYVGPYWDIMPARKSDWHFFTETVMFVHIPILHIYTFIFNIPGMITYAESRFLWAFSTTVTFGVIVFLSYFLCKWIAQGFNRNG